MPDHDKALTETIGKTKAVTAAMLISDSNDRRPILKTGFAFAGPDPKQFLPRFQGAVPCLDEIQNQDYLRRAALIHIFVLKASSIQLLFLRMRSVLSLALREHKPEALEGVAVVVAPPQHVVLQPAALPQL